MHTILKALLIASITIIAITLIQGENAFSNPLSSFALLFIISYTCSYITVGVVTLESKFRKIS